jgi:hypothetical protein
LEFHQISPFVKKESRTVTAGRELHPAPKKTYTKFYCMFVLLFFISLIVFNAQTANFGKFFELGK